MIDPAQEYLNTVEQDAIDNPKFDLECHVSIYSGTGDWVIDGCILTRWWEFETYYYEVWCDDGELQQVSEYRLERLIRSDVCTCWLSVIEGDVR